MSQLEETLQRLALIPDLQISVQEPLTAHTRFGIGGLASLLVDTVDEEAFVEVLRVVRQAALPWMVIGSGTNLVVADAGYPGVVVRYRGGQIEARGNGLHVQAGAELQQVVDEATTRGLRGLENMTGIPGQLGAAIYGNAGAYGSSISDFVARVRYFDGAEVRELDRDDCEFRYRSSIFKRHKDWFILSADLEFETADALVLMARAAEIRGIRDAKYPPTMRCAGSIFKNLLVSDLSQEIQKLVPSGVMKGGKIPAAWFLEASGVKGMRFGGIRVADYHANLIYNEGGATAHELRSVITELKRRVRERFGIDLEEEVQYVGFEFRPRALMTLERTVAALDLLLDGASSDELTWRPNEESWSIAEVLTHLAHAEEFCYAARVHRMLNEETPQVPAYDTDRFKELGIYQTQTAHTALRWLREMRQRHIRWLDAQPVGFEQAPAEHGNMGRVTLLEVLNEWATHDLGHVRQIAQLLRGARHYALLGPWQPDYPVNP